MDGFTRTRVSSCGRSLRAVWELKCPNIFFRYFGGKLPVLIHQAINYNGCYKICSGFCLKSERRPVKGHVIIKRYKYQEQLKNFLAPVSLKSDGVCEGGNA